MASSDNRSEPDPVIEAYKKDVDRTLLRENLRLTVNERFQKFESFMHGLKMLRGVAKSQAPGTPDLKGG